MHSALASDVEIAKPKMISAIADFIVFALSDFFCAAKQGAI
jgi:hypothetical protein